MNGIQLERPGFERLVLAGALLFVFGIANFFSFYVFDHIPHVQDSIAQLFQAKVFASGKLFAESHPLPEFFDYTHVINNGKWYGQYPPGHALLLMLGVLIGAPWVVNPVLGTLGVWATYALARRLHGVATALVTLGLVSLSPFLLFMSAGFMSHTSSMLCTALFALGYVRAVRDRSVRAGVGAGLALGFGVLVRPYSTLGVALPFIVWAVIQFLRRPRAYWRVFVALSAATSILLAALFAFNWITNGSPLTLGYQVLYGPEVGVGFGRGAWGAPHTPAAGVANSLNLVGALSLHLFGWPQLSLVPIGLLVLSRRMGFYDYLFLASIGSLLGFYFFYWYQDLCFGPRYLFDALPFLVILSARGLVEFPRAVADWFGREGTESVPGLGPARTVRWAEGILVVILTAYSLTVTFPALVLGQEGARRFQDRGYGQSYWGVDPYLGRLVDEEGLENALVFVRIEVPSPPWQPHDWFGSAFVHLSPDLDGNVVFAQDLGRHSLDLMEYFPDRTFYLYRGGRREGRLVRIDQTGQRTDSARIE